MLISSLPSTICWIVFSHWIVLAPQIQMCYLPYMFEYILTLYFHKVLNILFTKWMFVETWMDKFIVCKFGSLSNIRSWDKKLALSYIKKEDPSWNPVCWFQRLLLRESNWKSPVWRDGPSVASLTRGRAQLGAYALCGQYDSEDREEKGTFQTH